MLMDNNQIFRNCFVIIYCHLTKVSSQINKCIIYEANELSITLSTLWRNPLHPLYGALPVPYVPVQVTLGAVIAHRYTYAPPRCRTSQITGLSFPCQFLSRTILVTPCSMVWDWRVLRAGPMPFIGLAARSLFVSCCFLFLFFHSMGWCYGVGVFGLIGC